MSETPTVIVRHVFPTFRENVRGQVTALAATAAVVGGGLAVLVGIGEVIQRVNARKSQTPAPTED